MLPQAFFLLDFDTSHERALKNLVVLVSVIYRNVEASSLAMCFDDQTLHILTDVIQSGLKMNLLERRCV